MRFRKGTTDHDGDGRIGGSNPTPKGATDMAKTTTKAPAKGKAPAPRAKRTRAKPTDPAIEAERIERATVMDPQTGQDRVTEPLPTAAAVKAARKAEVEAQFATADAKGDPSAEELEAIRVGHQVRGF